MPISTSSTGFSIRNHQFSMETSKMKEFFSVFKFCCKCAFWDLLQENPLHFVFHSLKIDWWRSLLFSFLFQIWFLCCFVFYFLHPFSFSSFCLMSDVNHFCFDSVWRFALILLLFNSAYRASNNSKIGSDSIENVVIELNKIYLLYITFILNVHAHTQYIISLL